MIGYFVSPHGFGHATRAAAVMAAVHDMRPSVRFDIFTTVPIWLFQESLSGPFSYHSVVTDIGLIQASPLREDIPETLKHLGDFLPFDHSRVMDLASQANDAGCELIICDISPLGIAVAQHSGVPSMLVENFTWDWIYRPYADAHPQMSQHIGHLREVFETADYHVQTEPVCHRRAADLTTLPVSRRARNSRRCTRSALGIPQDSKAVVITMGGLPTQPGFLQHLKHQPDVYFIIPGGRESMRSHDNVVLLPSRSEFFHPDLINACDAVIGKAGYSTLAEVYHAGVPFGYVTRPVFPESEVLAEFIERQMHGIAIAESQFQDGSWLARVPDLLALPRIQRSRSNGAEQVAELICSRCIRP